MKKTASAAKKPTGRKLMITLAVLPVVVAAAAAAVWFLFPATSERPAAVPNHTTDPNEIVAKLNIPVTPPEPETQEKSAEIAEQKRIEAEKRRAEEEARLQALRKALEIKQAKINAQNKICFIGDSITEGGVYGERGAADRTLDILNAGYADDDAPFGYLNLGIGGSTTVHWSGNMVADIQKCATLSNLKIVMIMLGTNDAGYQVSTQTYLANMSIIRSAASNMGAMAVIVNCPIMLGSTTGQALITEYCNGLNANGVITPLALPLSDSIHPTSAGYNELAAQWANIIRAWVKV